MSLRICASVGLALSLCVAACSGTAPPPQIVTSPKTQRPGRPALPSNSIELGGVIDTDVFTVPAKVNAFLARDLFVFASKSVNVLGTLHVHEGTSVAIFTPSFSIGPKGAIVDISEGRNERRPTTNLLSACDVYFSARPWYVAPGDSLEITANYKPKQGHCLFSLVNGAGILLSRGNNGGMESFASTGQDGGSLAIGTAEAIAHADSVAEEFHHGELRAFAPDVLKLDAAMLQAGTGGNGQDDASGTLYAGVYEFTAYAGGKGGNVDIVAGKIAGTQPKIYAGSGGNGGTIGESSSYNDNPMDGTASSPNALPAMLSMGAGGDGGSIDVSVERRPHDIVFSEGNGGDSSLIRHPANIAPSFDYGAARLRSG